MGVGCLLLTTCYCLLVLLIVLHFIFLFLLLRQLLGLLPLCTRTAAWATLLAKSRGGDQGAEQVGLPWVVHDLSWNYFQAAFGLSWACLGLSSVFLGFLRPCFGPVLGWLEPISGLSWVVLGNLGPLLGLSWAVLGLSGDVLDYIGFSWAYLELSWAILGLSWAVLNLSWAVLDYIEFSWACLGLTWACLGCVLGLSLAISGPS